MRLRPAADEEVPDSGRGPLRDRIQPHHLIAAVVGLVYLVGSLVVLRDVVFAIPDILGGHSVLVGDELVPFFNPTSQLFDQAQGEFSDLTNGYEFRVRYAFLTTWMRHYKVLPFAVLLVLPLIMWVAYLVTAWFVTRCFTTLSRTTVYLAAALPTALIYMIMIYAKVTHFYTLVLGLCMMTISALVMLEALLFRERRWGRRMVLACLVTLLNPAVHYLILFALFMALTVVTLCLGELAKWARHGGPARMVGAVRVPPRARVRAAFDVVGTSGRRQRSMAALRRFNDTTIGRCAWSGVALVGVAMVPYALFVKFVALRGVPNLSETVPGDYYFIRDASVSLVHIMSWDLAGIMDKINYGDYLAKIPRVSNVVYMALAFTPLLVPGLRRSLFPTRRHRQLLGVIYVNVTFAIWATVGYGEPNWFPTFHRSLAALTKAAYSTRSAPGDLTLTISSTIVQVLRFPHRFQLLLFMLGPLLMTLPIAWCIDRLRGRAAARPRTTPADTRPAVRTGRSALARRPRLVAVLATLALGSVFFVPFLSNQAYRSAYTSGNFDGFFAAYPVDDLKAVKDELQQLPSGKTVVLPPTETAKLVVGPDEVPHKFIDKFFIYYLDQSSFYYGLTGDKENKFEFFLLLRALYYQQDWWVNIARDIGIDYIVLNKQVENNRGVGAEYLPDLETFLRTGLDAVPDHLAPVYENDSFVLYRLLDPAPPDRPVLLFDTSWDDYLDTVFARLDLSRCYDLQYISDYERVPDQPVELLATDPQSAAIDLWAVYHPGSFFVPSTKDFAFNSDVVASSYYLSPMFRLFLFFSDSKWNRNEMITPGIFGALRGSFIGVPRSTQFRVPVEVPETGRYRVLLRSAATANTLDVTSKTLGIDEHVELRSPQDALGLYSVDQIYSPDRMATDVSGESVEDLESRIPDELVPINLRYVYQDLGVVDATAGPHSIVVDKTDENPMLVEGILLVPEAVDASLALPESVHLVSDVDQLDCSEKFPVRTGSSDSVDAAANDAHADLTEEQLLGLLGADELTTAAPGGVGGRALHIGATVALVLAAIGIIRWRIRRGPQVDEDDPDERIDASGPPGPHPTPPVP